MVFGYVLSPSILKFPPPLLMTIFFLFFFSPLGIPFNQTDPWRLTIAEMAQNILGDNLIGLKAGNEPDFYSTFVVILFPPPPPPSTSFFNLFKF